ncbi:MAG: helix-turn-helix domain-containing protein [Clostridia bacterium]|nr:helix-turn-helix domain-containing protein [Clostridia bacterium]
MELGNKIKQLRNKFSLTQEQLADELGISAQSVSKWENSIAMPDITLLPKIAERFGVSIDELFDLTVEQKLNRIENRMDVEEELPHDVFWEYEEFLKEQMGKEEYKLRATTLIANLYGNTMRALAKKTSKYAREAIRLDPAKKNCQWLLNMAEGHYIWDWNLSNHNGAIEFYKDVIANDKIEPHTSLPYYYLLDNLIADHRVDEAEKYLAEFAKLPSANKVMVDVYPAYIALARYDEKKADEIMENLVKKDGKNSDALFEVAQYYARKCDYKKAIECYELSYEYDQKKPRYIDAPHAIAEIYEIMGDYKMAAKSYERIVESQRNEWGMTEEWELKDAEKELERLRALAK